MKIKDLQEKWSAKYKRSINCDNPRGFSQRAHCAGRKKNESLELDEDSMSLRDWFGKGKHGGAGGGGWDRYNTKGERIGKCGERKPGEGKPKCLSKAKAASLRASGGRGAIAAAVRRKRKSDPSAGRSGEARHVPNKSKRKMDESTMSEQRCPHCDGPLFEFSQLNEKRDACYYKVKSRYKIWPSAYASGALVKCRKVGAKNWGSKKKNESDERTTGHELEKTPTYAIYQDDKILHYYNNSNLSEIKVEEKIKKLIDELQTKFPGHKYSYKKQYSVRGQYQEDASQQSRSSERHEDVVEFGGVPCRVKYIKFTNDDIEIEDLQNKEGVWLSSSWLENSDQIEHLFRLAKHKLKQQLELSEGKTGPGLWANIRAKRERIKAGSGERMRKPGSKGAPSDSAIRSARGTNEAVDVERDGLGFKTLNAARNFRDQQLKRDTTGKNLSIWRVRIRMDRPDEEVRYHVFDNMHREKVLQAKRMGGVEVEQPPKD